MFRAWAAMTLEKIGTADDLPMLRKLAKTDPLAPQGPLPLPHPPQTLGPTYPVREAATAAIAAIEKKMPKEPGK